jgi:hypothetical protein
MWAVEKDDWLVGMLDGRMVVVLVVNLELTLAELLVL